jgi:outer membrane protein TolC
MAPLRKILTLLLIATMVAPSGCSWRRDAKFKAAAADGVYERVAAEIEYPAESACTEMQADESLAAPPPWTIDTQGTPEYWDVSLEEVIHLTMANSRVLRDLGGAVVREPAATRAAMDPAIVETDPRTGIEAALSDFDAQFLTSIFWEKNHRAFNNEFFGGGARKVYQDLGVFQAAITKRAATGSQFTVRHNVDYDANTAPGNRFPSAWNTNVEAEIRHPLLQGGGTQFNRIAGPFSTPGVYTGVLIARLNADVALNDFEIAVRDLVSNVENAYWDLYFGYRVLDARVQARNAALETWRKIYALNQSNRRGGEAEKEAQAREQYFRFQQDVQNALSGEPYNVSRNWNGLPSGAFQTTGGVLMAERRLRLLMGLPPSDARLLRPSDEPVAAKVDFDWEQITAEAATRRTELRRQKFNIRRRELELMASKNHLLPQLDAIGRYRWRGFGDDLFPLDPPPPPPDTQFDGAYSNLTSGNFQEWQLGFEFNMPIGFRRAHVAMRNAELLLARERAILRDQQREIIHEVADAVSELDRAYAVLQTSYNRLDASRTQVGAVQAAYDADKATLDLLLEAQRRVSDAETDYYLSRSRYSLGLKNVHFVKGTLLEYDGVFLAEGPWPGEAYIDAAKREHSRSVPRPLNYASSQSPVVSRGAYDQSGGAAGVVPRDGTAPTEEALPLVPPGSSPPANDQSAPGLVPADGAAPLLPVPTSPSTKLPPSQPEAVQASVATGPDTGVPSVIFAGQAAPTVIPVPTISLQPGLLAKPDAEAAAEPPPPEPQRLPPISAP